jgi:hypothetical protein
VAYADNLVVTGQKETSMIENDRGARHQDSEVEAADRVTDLLRVHVPISLLIDLTATTDSREILSREGGDASWLVPGTV